MINSYELSVWTHNDSFLRLLKGKDEFFGQAYNVFFKQTISGDQTLNFSIPLYVFNYETGSFDENPSWVLIFGEQKIRLIINKGDTIEFIHDFIINNYIERNEDYSKIMLVECQSYISYELNKIGCSIIFDDLNDIGIMRCYAEPQPLLGSQLTYFKEVGGIWQYIVDPLNKNIPLSIRNSIWIDYNNDIWKHNGFNWIEIPDIYDEGLPELLEYPIDPYIGDIWVNPSTGVHYEWSGSEWILSPNVIIISKIMTNSSSVINPVIYT